MSLLTYTNNDHACYYIDSSYEEKYLIFKMGIHTCAKYCDQPSNKRTMKYHIPALFMLNNIIIGIQHGIAINLTFAPKIIGHY